MAPHGFILVLELEKKTLHAEIVYFICYSKTNTSTRKINNML